MSVDTVRGVISGYFPHLWPAVEAGLFTCATLLLSDNANPVALIYVGPPSAGKTTVVSMFEGATFEGTACEEFRSWLDCPDETAKHVRVFVP